MSNVTLLPMCSGAVPLTRVLTSEPFITARGDVGRQREERLTGGQTDGTERGEERGRYGRPPLHQTLENVHASSGSPMRSSYFAVVTSSIRMGLAAKNRRKARCAGVKSPPPSPFTSTSPILDSSRSTRAKLLIRCNWQRQRGEW